MREDLAHRIWKIAGCGNRLTAAVCLAILAIPLAAIAASAPHATVNLIADQPYVRPGRAFSVGFHFQLEAGWHIYWTNPGDSGEPPHVKWQLPAGFEAGPLQWPVPQRIGDHSLIDYGYQNDVLFPVQISPPATLKMGSDVQLGARLSWLICREVCLPAHADLVLALPVAKPASAQPSPEHLLFTRARAEVPVAAPKAWKVTASLAARVIVLDIITGKRETAARFFPLEPNQVENAAAQKATPTAQGVRLELAKSDQLLKPPARITGVLQLASRQGYLISAPVISSK